MEATYSEVVRQTNGNYRMRGCGRGISKSSKIGVKARMECNKDFVPKACECVTLNKIEAKNYQQSTSWETYAGDKKVL